MNKTVWNHNKLAYGGDYNPEQFDEATWAEDMRLFKLAHIDTVTLNVFSWASLQPSEDEYNFTKLDKIMDMVRDNGMKVCLATSTGAHPAWMAKKYPEILRVDFDGRKHKFGGRHNSCPNSEVFRKYSARLAGKLAERYKGYDNIIGWHVCNEYGGECFCDKCEAKFREWLKNRYKTLDELNRVWDTAFWGHTFYDWDEIVLPNMLSEHFAYEKTTFQGISLDYRRFSSESMLNNYIDEYNEIKKYTPDIPVTTNFMGFYKMLDYRDWAKHLDFVSWDNYPANCFTPSMIATPHDLMRGVGDNKPFILMEQTPSVQNWQPYNDLKRPGVMRLWSYQAVAHGADSIMFFQMRRSVGACEKYHGAVIDHAGHENTRVFREVAALGAELDKIGDAFLGTTIKSKVGILFDWSNWWSIEYSAGPSILLKYRDEVQSYYDAFHAANIPVDFIGTDSDFSKYDVIIAPILYMVEEGLDEKIRSFTKAGGSFVTTYFSGYVDEHDLVTMGGYPGKLRDILGIWVEESDALPEGKTNSFIWNGDKHTVTVMADLLHLEGAKSLASYAEDFYAGMPVLTCNDFGKGKAYYVAVRSDEKFYSDFVKMICDEKKVAPVASSPANVEITKRCGDDDFLFILNHNDDEKELIMEYSGTDIITDKSYDKGEKISIKAKDVMIVKIK